MRPAVRHTSYFGWHRRPNRVMHGAETARRRTGPVLTLYAAGKTSVDKTKDTTGPMDGLAHFIKKSTSARPFPTFRIAMPIPIKGTVAAYR